MVIQVVGTLFGTTAAFNYIFLLFNFFKNFSYLRSHGKFYRKNISSHNPHKFLRKKFFFHSALISRVILVYPKYFIKSHNNTTLAKKTTKKSFVSKLRQHVAKNESEINQ
jgi:hypothetical protein